MARTQIDQSTIDKLDNYFRKQTELHDLHTHLLGMGDDGFWIDKILMKETILPNHQAFCDGEKGENLRKNLCRLVWNPYEGKFLCGKDVDSIFQFLIDDDYPNGSLIKLKELIERILPKPSNANTNYPSGPWNHVEETILNALFGPASVDRNHLGKLMKELKVLIEPELPEQKPVFYSMTENTNDFVRELRSRGLSFRNDFCYDVVLKLDDLADGLGLTNRSNQFIQTAVEEKLGFHLRTSTDRPTFRHWIIFNARQQSFEVAYGIRVEDLRKLIHIDSGTPEVANQIAWGHIVNTISMRDAQGTDARLVDFHSFQGMFTPEFYPRRFALKDSIYSQRLDVLAHLLCHVLERYDECRPPVTYCEFSVGVGDLTRPWIFDVLSSFSSSQGTASSTIESTSFWTLLQRGHFSSDHCDNQNDTSSQLESTWSAPKCTYKFLAGFNRQHVQTSYFQNQKQAINLLNEAPQIAIHLMLNEIEKSARKEYITEKTDMFYRHKEALDKMKESIRNRNRFYHWVVGLDLFGDEMGFPYCPFIARDFLDYVQEIRENFNKSFGLRIHCGENVPFANTTDPTYRHFAAHMYIAFRCLRYLQYELKYGIRVGHGIAFQRILDKTMNSSKHRKSSVLLAEIEHQAPYVFKTIPFEVNITSNEYLLGFALRNGTRQQPLQLDALFQLGVPIILATDNDGIWPINKCPCRRPSHFSLSGECCRAIATGIIKSLNHLKDIFRHMKMFRFYSETNELVMPEADISILPHDTRAFTIVIHPDIIKYIISLCSRPEQQRGKFYDAFKGAYSPVNTAQTNPTSRSPEELEEEEKRAWRDTCHRLAPFAYVSYCIENSGKHPELPGDTVVLYKSLFENAPNVTDVLREWRSVYQQLIEPNIIDQSQCVSTDSGNNVFFSEGPTDPNDKKRPMKDLIDYLQRDYHKHKETHIHAFTRYINVKTTSSEIEKQLKRDVNRQLHVYIYSNKDKEKYIDFDLSQRLRLTINHMPSQRTDHHGKPQRNGLYATCPHASAATAFLHLVSKELSDNTDIQSGEDAESTAPRHTTAQTNHDGTFNVSLEQGHNKNNSAIPANSVPLSNITERAQSNIDPDITLSLNNDERQTPDTKSDESTTDTN